MSLKPIKNKTALLLPTLLLFISNLLFAAPTTWVQSVTYNGETITMRLDREDLRGSNFELWSQNAAGGYDVLTPVDERSYLGTVDGYPGAVSCGILLDNGEFKGAVYFDRGVTWFTLDTAVVSTRALDYGTFSAFHTPGSSSVTAGQAGSSMYSYSLGIDADYDYVNTTSSGNTATALEGIEYSVCVTRAIYMRDVLLRPYLGRVVLRSTLAHDPYTGLTQGDYLNAVRTEWNANHTDTDHDLVAGVSPVKIGGGLAWVGVVGTSSGYSVNQAGSNGNFDVVFRHEMGHNWGISHFTGGSPEGAGLMGGNQPGRMSGPEAYKALAHRDSRISTGGILVNEGVYTAVELPPYASLDSAQFVQTVDSSVTIDVLANDHDANNQTVSLVTFDGTSANGGTVTQSGQDLVYTAPGSFLGSDYFLYTITDTVGRTATGAVTVDVQPGDSLRVYFPLDEASGTTADDASVFDRTGSVNDGTIMGVVGKFGNAVTMDGVDDHLTVTDLNVNSDEVTLTAWIKRPVTDQNDTAGIIFNRSQDAAGLNFGAGNALRYHWDGGNWHLSSGLVPPANQWVFVALVVKSDRATIYMHDGTLQQWTNFGSHNSQSFGGTTYIGRDPNSSRSFTGDLDEPRVYSRALTQAEILSLVAGGAAESPSPFDGAVGVQTPGAGWAPGGAATSYGVYLGTNQAAVTSANTGSPEYEGSTTTADWEFALQPTTVYYWRVDTVTTSGTITGEVWSFTTGSEIFETGLIAHWKMNDASGTTALDSTPNNNHGTVNGASWTTGFEAGGLTFDGINDSVTAGTGPSLSGQTDLTLTAWVKTSASSEQVIIQQRDGGFNGQYQLKINASGTVNFYIYGNSAYQFDFTTAATVNDGQWHFVSAIRNGANGAIYLDGNPTPAASASGTIRDLSASIGVGIGRDIRDNNKPFNGSIDEVKIYDFAKSGAELATMHADYLSGGNDAPTWNSSPVIEIAAIEGVGYNATLSDDASDLQLDPLTYSMVSAPTWLTVAPNGTLSGVPGSGNTGANNWIVDVSDGIAAPVQVTLSILVHADNDGDGIPDIADPDNDNDGIPDTWETAHGLNPLLDDKTEDPDGDTIDNWAEYIVDTDPQVPNSFPTLVAEPAPGTGDPLIKFPTSAARNYTVEYRNHLSLGIWLDLAPTAPGTGSEMSVSDSSTEVHRFYRLRIELP